MPHAVRYQLEPTEIARTSAVPGKPWVAAIREGTTNAVELGSRIAIQTTQSARLERLIDPTRTLVDRTLGGGWYILECSDALAAIDEAERLSALPGIRVSYPVMRRQIRLHSSYAGRPNDFYYDRQWNLEDRAPDGTPLGADLNLRAAWSLTRGEGTAVAIVDDGVDLEHPEFAERAGNDLHFNFGYGLASGLPSQTSDNHGTAVAGLAVAQFNNEIGMAGVAPAAHIASWKIFSGMILSASDEQMMDMFQYRSNRVSVQNHSWGNSGVEPLAPTPLEELGLTHAIDLGREGRGVIMVRSGGNGRDQMSDANDDAYASDPRAIAVGAVRRDGRAASYSSTGACLLVAAPGGADDANLLTTDRRGSAGFNSGPYADDFADYVYSSIIQGTSFSAPQVSGLAALLISANPALTYRDIQWILAVSARHIDLKDPDLRSNGAGLKLSHNVGYGIPDAGYAVDLARRWNNRPPPIEQRFVASPALAIPDDGYRITVSGSLAVPGNIASIPGTPSLGSYADNPTDPVPIVDIGLAASPVVADLTGKAALIQRGTHLFIDKIEAAAQAGAVFAIIYNHQTVEERLIMAATEYASIPALFIGREMGEALKAQLNLDPTLRARLSTTPARTLFTNLVADAVICEHVGLRVATTHSRRGDLRITLISPAGTRSILQRINNDPTPGPSNWTYYSVHHFLEPSRGLWEVEITDQQPLNLGSITELELILRGVPIDDTDNDGLDDDWELIQFKSLDHGLRDDSDGDGLSNALEQLFGTQANSPDRPLSVDISNWNDTHFRLSWPGIDGTSYRVLGLSSTSAAPVLLSTVAGRFPVTEYFVPRTDLTHNFFRLRTTQTSHGLQESIPTEAVHSPVTP